MKEAGSNLELQRKIHEEHLKKVQQEGTNLDFLRKNSGSIFESLTRHLKSSISKKVKLKNAAESKY